MLTFHSSYTRISKRWFSKWKMRFKSRPRRNDTWAYSNFERKKGLEVGKWADFVMYARFDESRRE
jgi:hypothetical protein